jgi:cell division protein ZapE
MTIKKSYKDKTDAGDLKHDMCQEAAAAALSRLYDDLQAEPEKGGLLHNLFGGKRAEAVKGVYMHGGVGRGKTMLMDLFFNHMPYDYPKRRVHFHEFMLELHDYIHQLRQAGSKAKDNESHLLKFADHVAKQVKLLCFDEFHVTNVADAMILQRLFTALFSRGVAVVITTNWEPDRLYEGGLQRELFLPFIDLVKERMEIISLGSGLDYRDRILSETGTYFYPLTKQMTDKANDLFDDITHFVPPEPETLKVKGREIHVERTSEGVARFTFAELCERPYGAVDYLAIAAAYHTIFLEDVPKLKYDRRNEAKRLMTLIDALYDKRRRLVVVADAPPDELYLGKDHAFEFERTVSRLTEMQSEEYLVNEFPV